MKRIASFLLACVMLVAMLPAVTMEVKAATYDVSKAVAYANAHWNDGKGLCAEFVSDCLAAGGISIPNSASYYSSSTQSYNNNSGTLGAYTNPYTCSASLLLYLSKSYTVITNPTSNQIAVGDVVFMYSGEWRDGHVGIVISTTGGTPVYAAHNRATNSGEFYSNYPCTYVVKMNGQSEPHTCDKGTYLYYEAAHPHYKCYECSVCGKVWRNTAEPTTVSSCASCVPQKTIDSRYSSYFPIAAYPISTGHISVYDATGTVYSNRYIDGLTDICIIWEIYTDGWCKVRYPSSAEESGYFDAYVPFSTFTDATSPTFWTATEDYTTYKRSDLESTMHNVSSEANCLLLKTNGYLKQIIHPVSGQSYYMMGWIAEPKQIHVGNDSVGVMLGGQATQTIYVWTTGYYNGTTSLYFKKGNENISCSWGDWENGKAPLTITGKNEGTTTLTVGVMVKDTGEVLDSTSIAVVIGANTYTISYNANGGSGAPSSQTKKHGTTLTLSTTKPSWSGHTFLGWSTSSSATSASYQPGGSFTENSDTTLYAVWKKGCESSSHSYSYTVTTTPTTSSAGALTGTCSKCSGTTTVTLPKLNTTDYSYKVVTAATCTANGTGRYTWKTTTYGTFYFDVTISKTGHSYSYKVTKTPTTSAAGTLTGTCSKCSGTTTVTLPKLNTTDYTYKVTKEPSYTATGTGRYTWNTTTYGTFYFDVTLDKLADSDAAQIVVGSKTATCGSNVEIDVEIANNPGFSVLNVAFIYDTEYLTLLEVENHLSMMTMTSDTTVVWDAVENYTGNGALCTLKFEISEDAPDGEYEIQVLFISASNDEFEELNMRGVTGTLEICNILYGDVNGDGKIASVDLAMLRKYLASVDPITGASSIAVKAGADCNGDGKITSVDLAMLRKYLASVDPITGESSVVLGPR